jgi:predicted RNase H-like nuclease (RuvC/YqgF family)
MGSRSVSTTGGNVREMESENEMYRREMLNRNGYIEILEGNVKELQGQLQQSYKRIEELNQELNNAKSEVPRVVSRVDGLGKPS